MPRLREYLCVGFDSGYGDADYSVSMGVCDLTPQQYNELRAMCVCAIGAMEDHWRRAQAQKMPKAQKEIAQGEK